MPSLVSPFHPMLFIHTCSSRSSSSPTSSHKAFLKKMSREFSDIWKEEISQAAPIPPRAGKQPYGVAQGSADFMGPVEMCGSRLLTPASTPSQPTHGEKARFKGADMRSGARTMLRKWRKRAADRYHRFYIRSQEPNCL